MRIIQHQHSACRVQGVVYGHQNATGPLCRMCESESNRLQSIAVDCSRLQASIALLAFCLLVATLVPQAGAADNIPVNRIEALDEALADSAETRSQARQRLTIRRLIRKGEALIEKNPDAPNRFRAMGTLYDARQKLLELDDSPENRAAFLDLCRRLAEAPDEYAEARFDADLLLSQTKLARQGATPTERAEALRAFIDRYRGTAAEKRMLMTATAMTLELGNAAVEQELHDAIAERFWSDLEMVRFRRDKFGGEVMGAPFLARLKTADGSTAVYPMDRLGRSTLFFFWSKDSKVLDHRIAKWNTLAGYASGPKDPEVTHRLAPELIDIVSVNLDDLPDAGASILREKGVDWQALHLPGGRDSEIYRTYAMWDPMGLHVGPSGCAALLLPGLHKHDYPRRVFSYAQNNRYYLRQLQWLVMGEFLVVDPVAEFNPAVPPELKAAAPDHQADVLLPRTPASVPAKVLQKIQGCFVPPPSCYRLTNAEALSNYKKAEKLCRKAIAAHAKAPDLWLVQNRLIMALMGQWKMTCDPAFLARAGEASEAALELKPPKGAEVVPRLCLARLALREPDQDPAALIQGFVEACGGTQKSGAAVAAATYLALDVGNRRLHEKYRRTLLDDHDNNSMVWPVAAALLDRFHRHQLFRPPYYRGWSFGRRDARYYQSGKPQDATRILHAKFKTLNGDAVKFPDENGNTWNVIIFCTAPKDAEKVAGANLLQKVKNVASQRHPGEIKAWMAILHEDADRLASAIEDPLKSQTLIVPNGLRHPVVQRLGIYQVNEHPNMAIIRPDGTIAVVVSGLAWHKGGPAVVLRNTLQLADEAAVDAALAKGDIKAAQRIAFHWAPVDKSAPKGKKHAAGISQVHLRSRAKVYMAMEKWKLALADLNVLVDRQRAADARLSQETVPLLEALRLQRIVRKELGVDDDMSEEEWR